MIDILSQYFQTNNFWLILLIAFVLYLYKLKSKYNTINKVFYLEYVYKLNN